LAHSADALREAVEGAAARNDLADAAARLTVSRGPGPRGLAPPDAAAPRVFVTVAPAAPPPGPRVIAEADVRRASGSVAATCKTLSYADNVAALAQARVRGGAEAVILDAAGRISGAAAANLFWIRDGRVFTPALSGAVMPGTARAAVCAAMAMEEGGFGVEELMRAEAAFLTNALTGVAPVAAVVAREGGRADLDADHPMLVEIAATERGAP
jgi:branched-subunit amino acid aminotransferase/4-amino-4-deoxychorismate lyase